MLRTHLGPLLLWSNVVTFLLRFHYQLQKIKNPLFSTCCLALPVVRSCPIATKLLRCRECPLCAKSRHRAAYSITSSARASSIGGTARPIALAVLRLITSSNLVGCSTGRSLGFAPLKILSATVAARRKSS